MVPFFFCCCCCFLFTFFFLSSAQGWFSDPPQYHSEFPFQLPSLCCLFSLLQHIFVVKDNGLYHDFYVCIGLWRPKDKIK